MLRNLAAQRDDNNYAATAYYTSYHQLYSPLKCKLVLSTTAAYKYIYAIIITISLTLIPHYLSALLARPGKKTYYKYIHTYVLPNQIHQKGSISTSNKHRWCCFKKKKKKICDCDSFLVRLYTISELVALRPSCAKIMALECPPKYVPINIHECIIHLVTKIKVEWP